MTLPLPRARLLSLTLALGLPCVACKEDSTGGGGAGHNEGEGEGAHEGEGEGSQEGEGEGAREGEGEGREGEGEGEDEGEACPAGAVRNVPFAGDVTHQDEGTEIDYDSVPPAAGDHYGAWASWGEQDDLDPRFWVHNLEHGGIVFLHDCPDGCAEIVDASRAFAGGRAADDGGDFRWILTSYSGMNHALAVVAWEWIYEADCWSTEEVQAFVEAHYRQAPEDVGRPGGQD